MRDLGRGAGVGTLVAVPRWLGFLIGAVALVLVVVLVVGLLTLAGRLRTVESRTAAAARADDLRDLSAKIDRLSDRVSSARRDMEAVGRLGSRISGVADDLAAHVQEDRSGALADGVKDLESMVASLEDGVREAKRLAAGAAEREAPEETEAGVAPEDLDRLGRRVDEVAAKVDELGKRAAVRTTSDRGSTGRVDEDALKKFVEGLVTEQLPAAIEEAMRNRPRGRRPGDGN